MDGSLEIEERIATEMKRLVDLVVIYRVIGVYLPRKERSLLISW